MDDQRGTKSEGLIQDGVDDGEPTLARMAGRRPTGHRRVGYTLTEPTRLELGWAPSSTMASAPHQGGSDNASAAGAEKEGTAWMLDLSELNEAQAAAVRAGAGPQLVLAGPGTGKTLTLVSRFAFLVDRGVDPRRILTLTFTRKAADEMVDRVTPMLPASTPSGLWVGTFHGLAGRMLRSMAEDAGLTPDFRILDAQR